MKVDLRNAFIIAELEAKLDKANLPDQQESERNTALEERIAELEAKLDRVREITDEIGEDTRLGSEAIGQGVMVISNYLERLQSALGEDDAVV